MYLMYTMMLQMSPEGTPFSAVHEVAMLLAEWSKSQLGGDTIKDADTLAGHEMLEM